MPGREVEPVTRDHVTGIEHQPELGSIELRLLILTRAVGIHPLAIDHRAVIATWERLLPGPGTRREILPVSLALIVGGRIGRRAVLLAEREFDIRTRSRATGEELVIIPVPVGGLLAVVLVDPDLRVVVRLVEPLAEEVGIRLERKPAESTIRSKGVLIPRSWVGTVGRRAAPDRNRGIAVR